MVSTDQNRTVEHNITPINMNKALVINAARCSKCNRCIQICDVKAIIEKENYNCGKCIKYCLTMEVECTPGSFIINNLPCNQCDKCIEICPEKAIYKAVLQ